MVNATAMWARARVAMVLKPKLCRSLFGRHLCRLGCPKSYAQRQGQNRHHAEIHFGYVSDFLVLSYREN